MAEVYGTTNTEKSGAFNADVVKVAGFFKTAGFIGGIGLKIGRAHV